MNSINPVALSILIKDISSEGFRLYLQKRVEDGPLNGFLEFPGGKIRSGERPEAAAKRELYEEAKINAPIDKSLCKLLKIYQFTYPDRSVCLYAYIMRGDNLGDCSKNWVFIPFSVTYDENEKIMGSVIEGSREIIFDLVDYIGPYVKEGNLELLWK